MEELPARGFGLELEEFAPASTPPLFDEDSPEDEGSRASPVPPNKSQSFTGSEVQAVAEAEEEQPPLISASFQDLNISSTSYPDAYIEINDLLDPNPPTSISDNSNLIYEDSDDYFDPEELLELLGIKSDQT
ncbi:uncharacterized protein LOC110020862 [Phalaenopsis equestris]|uniref:uncharacterized protein LOC110020862 n=1 Tax=Phalaenopsis equestris TaxID=78828 RepID=UPI0009E55A77|nr:uncharacterized protein LOC110020862 [Phalaenopsis equestris]